MPGQLPRAKLRANPEQKKCDSHLLNKLRFPFCPSVSQTPWWDLELHVKLWDGFGCFDI